MWCSWTHSGAAGASGEISGGLKKAQPAWRGTCAAHGHLPAVSRSEHIHTKHYTDWHLKNLNIFLDVWLIKNLFFFLSVLSIDYKCQISIKRVNSRFIYYIHQRKMVAKLQLAVSVLSTRGSLERLVNYVFKETCLLYHLYPLCARCFSMPYQLLVKNLSQSCNILNVRTAVSLVIG